MIYNGKKYLYCLLFCCLFFVISSVVRADISTIGIEELKPGMIGYGLSVFRGEETEKFPVTMVDIVKSPWPGKRLILIEIDEQQFPRAKELGSGFSGSPIYFNGRLAGAISMLEKFQTRAIIGVTPIQDMLDELTRYRKVFDRQDDLKRHPLSAITDTALPVPEPGSMIHVALMRGDVWMGTSGTVTALIDDMILAFGHENHFTGATVILPMHMARVNGIIPRLDLSHKIATATVEIGAAVWDGKQAVIGKTGVRAPMIPVRAFFQRRSGMEGSNIETMSYEMEIAAHEKVIPFISGITLFSIIDFLFSRDTSDTAISMEYRLLMKHRPAWLSFSIRHDIGNERKGIIRSTSSVLEAIIDNNIPDMIPMQMEFHISELEEGRKAIIRNAYFDKESARCGEPVTLYIRIAQSIEEAVTVSTQISIPEDYPLERFPVTVTPGHRVIPHESRPQNRNDIFEHFSNLLRSDDLVVLHPGYGKMSSYYSDADVDRTVKRVPWSLEGKAETSIKIHRSNRIQKADIKPKAPDKNLEKPDDKTTDKSKKNKD